MVREIHRLNGKHIVHMCEHAARICDTKDVRLSPHRDNNGKYIFNMSGYSFPILAEETDVMVISYELMK